MFKSAVASDCLMMTGNFAGLGVRSLARLSRRWLNRKSCRSGGKLTLLFASTFCTDKPNEINTPIFMRKL
jgi:hypothetical protein